MCYNWDSQNEYISFCDVALDNNNVDLEYIDTEYIKKYMKQKELLIHNKNLKEAI